MAGQAFNGRFQAFTAWIWDDFFYPYSPLELIISYSIAICLRFTYFVSLWSDNFTVYSYLHVAPCFLDLPRPQFDHFVLFSPLVGGEYMMRRSEMKDGTVAFGGEKNVKDKWKVAGFGSITRKALPFGRLLCLCFIYQALLESGKLHVGFRLSGHAEPLCI